MDLQLNLKDDQIKAMVSEAIMRSLDPATRESVIREAIQFLLAKPDAGSYSGRRVSPLEEAFRNAVINVAQEMAYKVVGEDAAVRAAIRDMLTEAVAKLYTDREKIVEKFATAIGNALDGRDRY